MPSGDGKTYILERIREEDRGFSSPCWVWQLSLNEAGYARTKMPGFPVQMRVHRAAYELWVGPIPNGMVADHLCRVRECVNPAHLEIVTSGENTRRAMPFGTTCLSSTAKNRGRPPLKEFCKRGHRLDAENLFRLKRAGVRRCKLCARILKLKYREAAIEERR